jgi:hypothetical protein
LVVWPSVGAPAEDLPAAFRRPSAGFQPTRESSLLLSSPFLEVANGIVFSWKQSFLKNRPGERLRSESKGGKQRRTLWRKKEDDSRKPKYGKGAKSAKKDQKNENMAIDEIHGL